MIWYIPTNISIGKKIEVISDITLQEDCCHSNVDEYVKLFGGERLTGYYIVKHLRLDILQLIGHSIWKYNNRLIDITPYADEREYNWFLEFSNPRHNLYVESPGFINKSLNQETLMSYYVYAFINPETDNPFYVGKGMGDRAYDHFRLVNHKAIIKENNRFYNKLRALIKDNKPPKVIFLAENIEDEDMAYSMEEDFILHYGREGYEEGGILLNTCLGGKLPNHKNRTYEQIYGAERAIEQRAMRSRLQKEAGGYGPKKYTDKQKEKLIIARARTAKEQTTINFERYKVLLKEFCEFFNGEVSNKRWNLFCLKIKKMKAVPVARIASLDELGLDIYEYCEKYLDATKKSREPLLWYHNPATSRTFRIYQWEIDLNLTEIPKGYIRGRGGDPWNSKTRMRSEEESNNMSKKQKELYSKRNIDPKTKRFLPKIKNLECILA